MHLRLALLLVWAACGLVEVEAQETAAASTASALQECYANVTLLDRNNLPAATMPVLIDLVRKVEDRNTNLNLRQLAVLLLHTYRQDGIQHHQTASISSNVLPYSPKFYSFWRHQLLLLNLVPNTLMSLDNDTLSSVDKCAMHHMLSLTVAEEQRGDEGAVCSQLAQYRGPRVRRRAGSHALPPAGDIELLDKHFLENANMMGRLQYNPKDDVEADFNSGPYFERQTLLRSQCPLMDGIVHTPWGPVAAGSVIAGIAAGAERQSVRVADLVKGGTVSNHPDAPTTIDNLYPATITGDLAEAILLQGVLSNTVVVGTSGGWNSTQGRRHYLLQAQLNYEMTDPELRGDIDGFILGSLVQSTLNTYSNLKLSQLLDMYYSPRMGIYSQTYRACNRKDLYGRVANTATLVAETYGFAIALNSKMLTEGTLTGGIPTLATEAVNSMNNYLVNMNDVTCTASESTALQSRLRTNLYLVVDASWQFSTVYPAVSYLLDLIEVGKFGSSVTLISASDGQLILNTTFSPALFHSVYTPTLHQNLPQGVDILRVLQTVGNLTAAQLDLERTTNYVGGNSSVLLFMLNAFSLHNQEEILAQATHINETVPDLRVIYATSSNQQASLWSLVREQEDLVTLALTSNGANVDLAMAPLVARVTAVNRRISNPLCGATWENQDSGQRTFIENIEPNYINYYSLHPNYFYINDNENRKIVVSRSGSATGTFIVCHSRSVRQPGGDQATTVNIDEGSAMNGVVCETLGTSGSVEVSLVDACSGYHTINSCPPLYLSVRYSSLTQADSLLTATCTDNSCRFPYEVKFNLQVEGLGCYSSASALGISGLLLLVSYLLVLVR